MIVEGCELSHDWIGSGKKVAERLVAYHTEKVSDSRRCLRPHLVKTGL